MILEENRTPFQPPFKPRTKEDYEFWEKVATLLDMDLVGFTFRDSATFGAKDRRFSFSIDKILADKIIQLEKERKKGCPVEKQNQK